MQVSLSTHGWSSFSLTEVDNRHLIKGSLCRLMFEAGNMYSVEALSLTPGMGVLSLSLIVSAYQP